MSEENWETFIIYVNKLEKMVIKMHQDQKLTEEEQFSKEEYAICNEYSFINPKIGI